jgi:hypothetical protein
MSLRKFIRARKTIVDAGVWSDKRMPKTGGRFPLSKARSYRVGAPGWRWRVIQISVGPTNYRLLAVYHAQKQNFQAVVAVDLGADMLVLGRLEWHSTHTGMHMHGCCDEPDKKYAGRLQYSALTRVPSGRGRHRVASPVFTDVAALEIVTRYFRLRLDEGPEQTEMSI